jgi:hypothetical protein
VVVVVLMLQVVLLDLVDYLVDLVVGVELDLHHQHLQEVLLPKHRQQEHKDMEILEVVVFTSHHMLLVVAAEVLVKQVTLVDLELLVEF